MRKLLVAYKTEYGSTWEYAEWIAEEAGGEAKGIDGTGEGELGKCLIEKDIDRAYSLLYEICNWVFGEMERLAKRAESIGYNDAESLRTAIELVL